MVTTAESGSEDDSMEEDGDFEFDIDAPYM